MKKVKIAIIGAGTAGLSARREVEKVTNDYLIFDGGPIGTTCARVGCMPSKVLIQVANNYESRSYFDIQGITGQENLQINTTQVMSHVRKLRDRFVNAVNNDIKLWQHKLVQENVIFLNKNTLQTSTGETYFAEKIIIATGSKPLIPAMWSKYSDYLITTDNFFELKALPKKMVVIGLGVIGIELGQALSRLGIEVQLVGLGKGIGGVTDPIIQDYIAKKFTEQLKISYDGAKIIGVKDNQLEVEIGGKVELFDKGLVAIGRVPNINTLNLAILGINHPDYSSTTYQLKNYKNIYFVGDCNKQRPLLHEAADQGRIAGYNAVRDENTCFRKRCSLGITFSDPNIAVVGQSYKDLVEKNIDFVVGKVSFEGQGRSIVKLKEQGLLHVYVDKISAKLLGCELQAPDGEHLAHLLSWAISNNMRVQEVLTMPFYHPVIEEGVRTALRDAHKQLQQKEDSIELQRCKELFRCEDTPIR